MQATLVAAKAVVIWVAIVGIAVLNGTVRELLLVPAVGPFPAMVVSGVVLCACILGLAVATVPWYGGLSAAGYWWSGVLWLCLTLVFEFVFGRYVRHESWAAMLEAYTFKGGNLWPLVLAVTLVSPRLAARLRGLR